MIAPEILAKMTDQTCYCRVSIDADDVKINIKPDDSFMFNPKTETKISCMPKVTQTHS